MWPKPHSSRQPRRAPRQSLHIPLSLSQTRFPRAESDAFGSLNSKRYNSRTTRADAPEEGPEQRNPWAHYSLTVCALDGPGSPIWAIRSCCVSSVRSPGWDTVLCYAKCPLPPAWGFSTSLHSLSLQLALQLHTHCIPQHLPQLHQELQTLSWGFMFQILQLSRSNAACSILTECKFVTAVAALMAQSRLRTQQVSDPQTKTDTIYSLAHYWGISVLSRDNAHQGAHTR